jgi:hypothetical protein
MLKLSSPSWDKISRSFVRAGNMEYQIEGCGVGNEGEAGAVDADGDDIFCPMRERETLEGFWNEAREKIVAFFFFFF